MRYEDFIVRIGHDLGDGFEVLVDAPAGDGKGNLPRSILNLTASASELTGTALALETGGALFDALFHGEVLDLFNESRGGRADPGRGLRILLKVESAIPESHDLYRLPWEQLYRAKSHDFLSLTRSTSVVRYLELARPRRSSVLPARLRILVAASSPSGYPPLDLERERRNIDQALKDRADLEVTYSQNTKLSALREAALEHAVHVIHFMGHGDATERRQGRLILENEEGAFPVSGEDIATQLKDLDNLRLVVLNACETALSPGDYPFAGVASALVTGGLPAVVAMRRPITDLAAVAFSRAFYQRLAAGDPVDQAVVEGRLAIHAANPETDEWATPTLFLRHQDASIFPKPSLSRRLAAVTVISLLLAAFALTGIILRRPEAVEHYRVRLTVIDSLGHPTQASEVGVSVGAERQEVAGGWELEIPRANRPEDGLVEVWAREGPYFGQTRVVLSEATVLPVRIALAKPEATLRGTVKSASSYENVENVEISIWGYEDEAVVTGADGTFTMPAHAALGERVRLLVRHPLYETWDEYHLVTREPIVIVLNPK